VTGEVDPDDKHVTRRELALELGSFRNEMRVLIVGGIVVLKFDVPKEITAVGFVLVAAKTVWTALVSSRF
jgi:hypothetical protein